MNVVQAVVALLAAHCVHARDGPLSGQPVLPLVRPDVHLLASVEALEVFDDDAHAAELVGRAARRHGVGLLGISICSASAFAITRAGCRSASLAHSLARTDEVGHHGGTEHISGRDT